jgi:transcriptional regulator with XRE-family HTH domain
MSPPPPRRDRGEEDAAEELASLKGLGLAVEQLRREAEMTHDEVARRGKLASTTIAEVEKGLKEEPRWETLRRLAKGLDVEIGDLAKLSVELAPGPAGDRMRQRSREAASMDKAARVARIMEEAKQREDG